MCVRFVSWDKNPRKFANLCMFLHVTFQTLKFPKMHKRLQFNDAINNKNMLKIYLKIAHIKTVVISWKRIVQRSICAYFKVLRIPSSIFFYDFCTFCNRSENERIFWESCNQLLKIWHPMQATHFSFKIQ